MRLRNPNLGPNSGKRILNVRILDPNSGVEFFGSVFFQQKRPPEKFTLKKFTSQNSPSKIQPRNWAQIFTLHLCKAIWVRKSGQVRGAKTHPKSRNTKITARLRELFRKVRANFCPLPCDTSQEPDGNCSDELVQMNFFILGGFFRVDFPPLPGARLLLIPSPILLPMRAASCKVWRRPAKSGEVWHLPFRILLPHGLQAAERRMGVLTSHREKIRNPRDPGIVSRQEALQAAICLAVPRTT